MSRTLYVAKTYKVEWEGTYAFNHKDYEFRILLNELGVGVCSMADNEDYLDFEISKEDWQKAINILSKQTVSDGIKDALDELDCTREEALEVFKKCLDKAEPDDTWMHFSFF